MKRGSHQEPEKKSLFSIKIGHQLMNLPRASKEKRYNNSLREIDEEVLFIEREKERELEKKLKERKALLKVHKKKIGITPDRTGVIRRLFDSEYNIDTRELVLPDIGAGRGFTGGRRELAVNSGNFDSLNLTKPKDRYPVSEQKMRESEKEDNLSLIPRRHNANLNITKGERESVREYIQCSRSILLAKLAINEKEKEAERMNDYIKRKESILELNKEIYEQDKKMVNDYVEYMKNQAEQQKINADNITKQRKRDELNLDEKLREKIELNKRISDYKDEMRNLLDCKNFIFKLNPALKETIEHKPKTKKPQEKTSVLITQQDNKTGNEAEEPNNIWTELSSVSNIYSKMKREFHSLKTELELSESESDTEIPTGFNSVSEIIDLLQEKEETNLMLIKEAHKREDSLERARKNFRECYGKQKSEQDKIKKDLREMKEDMKRKEELYSDLKIRNQDLSSLESLKQTEEAIREWKKELKQLIETFYRKCSSGAKEANPAKEKGTESSSLKTLESMLEEATQYVFSLKIARSYKIMQAINLNKLDALFTVENKEAGKCKENMANIARENAEKREKDLKDAINARRKKKRVTRTIKEMNKKTLHEIKKESKHEEKVEEEDQFNDIYFLE